MQKFPRALKIILVLVGIAVLIGIIANNASRTREPQLTHPSAPIPSRSQALAPTVQPTLPPTGPLTTFGDGVWEVGVDIAPGKYKTSGPDGSNCYYSRLQENNGTLRDILDNGNSDGPVTITIKDSDGYFESRGCNDWVLQ